MNPAWVDRINAFMAKAVVPLIGDTPEPERSRVDRRSRASSPPMRHGVPAGRGPVSRNWVLPASARSWRASAKVTIAELIAQDKALEPEANAIATVDKLVRYNRDLHRLLINFINFRDFYDRDGEAAIFQAGTLYLDQRSCELCVRVEDHGQACRARAAEPGLPRVLRLCAQGRGREDDDRRGLHRPATPTT